mmetsp:Transcript_52149/g.124246  ORF Transcript_52149/g.124246 Transcript_52149/m.124246 type:complete len:1076 (+) Transcript_52149:74-3301(+)
MGRAKSPPDLAAGPRGVVHAKLSSFGRIALDIGGPGGACMTGQAYLSPQHGSHKAVEVALEQWPSSPRPASSQQMTRASSVPLPLEKAWTRPKVSKKTIVEADDMDAADVKRSSFQDSLMPFFEQHEDDEFIFCGGSSVASQGNSLGSIQPDGRAQVLRHWYQGHLSADSSSKAGLRGGTGIGERKAATPFRAVPPLDVVRVLQDARKTASVSRGSEEVSKLDWGTLSEKSRQAIRLWVSGQIGGRHCLMLLEYDHAVDFLISPLDADDVVVSHLRGGGVLNALSGLQAVAHSGSEGGWLFEAVFSKKPTQVVEEALAAAQEEVADIWLEPAGNLSMEQVNLSIRRQAMQVQFNGLHALIAESSQEKLGAQARSSTEEYMQMQVWLELLRLHAKGGVIGVDAGGPKPPLEAIVARTPPLKAGADEKLQSWDDRCVLDEITKAQKDLEDESHRMSLGALRSQNKSIEGYLMRLVRQRDELKRMVRLAAECDSYVVLGLDGPEVSEDDVKKAYRSLARKEHPDKAGIANTERFQEIQQAYNLVLRQRSCSKEFSELSQGDVASPERPPSQVSNRPTTVSKARAMAKSSAEHAAKARDEADRIAVAAHLSMRLNRNASEAQGLPKKSALRILQELTRQNAVQLTSASRHLRHTADAMAKIAKCARVSVDEYGEWAEMAIAGAGMRERASGVERAGHSAVATADHLERTSKEAEVMLRKMARTSFDMITHSELIHCVRFLMTGLKRTSALARHAADEAISATSAGLELSCSLVSLDREWTREQAAASTASAFGATSPHAPRPQDDGKVSKKDAEDRDGDNEETDRNNGGDDDDKDAQDGSKPPDVDDSEEDNAGGSKDSGDPRQKLSVEGVRKEHATLRIRNLQCLRGLNEEVLGLQAKIRRQLTQGRGALLPSCSTSQKGGVFDLISQIFQAALVDVGRQLSEWGIQPGVALERSFSFALALEHSKEVALASEVRTTVLKLAALIDTELLTQIINEPLRKQLIGVGAKKRVGTPSVNRAQRSGPPGHGRARSKAPPPPAADDTWVEAVDAFCERFTKGVKTQLPNPAGASGVPAWSSP